MRYLNELFQEKYISEKEYFVCYNNLTSTENSKKINILALGDVGGMLLTGLKLMGGGSIYEIGIYDIDEKNAKRYEMEINQIAYPDMEKENSLPNVKIINKEDLFECDCFIFCASKGVPNVGEEINDVRMSQYHINKELVELYAKDAIKKGFEGIFAIVSDPVDPLCMAAVNVGIKKSQVRGFGLGVMNARATYYAKRDDRFEEYLHYGRAYGPHGENLVIANNIKNYNHQISQELTKLAVESNLVTRKLGYKPYIAPALSSGAISIIMMLKGEWHYSSICFGKAFLGLKNRIGEAGTYVENPVICEELFDRISFALESLEKLI